MALSKPTRKDAKDSFKKRKSRDVEEGFDDPTQGPSLFEVPLLIFSNFAAMWIGQKCNFIRIWMFPEEFNNFGGNLWN